MKINLIAVGTRMPTWVNEGFKQYAQRLRSDLQLNLIEVEAAKRTKSATADQLKQSEAKKILQHIQPHDHTIALDENGKQHSTVALSTQIATWQQNGKTVNLLIGGPDGLAADLLLQANSTWSLSALTLPHPLVRVIMAEQLYRAWSLLHNHPYHRA